MKHEKTKLEVGQPYIIRPLISAAGYPSGIQEIVVIAKSPNGNYINVLTTNEGDAPHTHDWHHTDTFLEKYAVLSELHYSQSMLFSVYRDMLRSMKWGFEDWKTENEHTPA